MSGVPIYRHQVMQTDVVRVTWVPTADGEPVYIDLGGSSGRAFPCYGQDLKVDDWITVHRIGQTYQVGSLIRRPSATPTDDSDSDGGT